MKSRQGQLLIPQPSGISMYLVNSRDQEFVSNPLMASIDSASVVIRQPNSIIELLLGEERPTNMLMLLSILVLLLHGWGLLWLMRPVEQITLAKPLVMEVSMIAVSAPKPSVAPPTPKPPAKKAPPKKHSKPIVKKMQPVVQKALDFAPTEQIIEPQPAAQTTSTESTTLSDSHTTSNTNAEPFTEASFSANYAHNPKPEYPAAARSRGWQGRVLLRVEVSEEGLSQTVAVQQSSGHDMLDESAMDAVKQWRFIPAKRGEIAVASSVLVPIIFTLRN